MTRSRTAMTRNLSAYMVSARTTRWQPPRLVMRIVRKRRSNLRREARSRPRLPRRPSRRRLIRGARMRKR